MSRTVLVVCRTPAQITVIQRSAVSFGDAKVMWWLDGQPLLGHGPFDEIIMFVKHAEIEADLDQYIMKLARGGAIHWLVG
jgi:hypothetical protein